MPDPDASNGRSSDELIVIVVLRARDRERAGVLEPADGRDDAPLRLLDDAAPLRRLELHLLHEHLRAALRHVLHDLLLHVVGDASEREREVLLVDLLEDELESAVVELDDVLEDEQQHADLLRELGVELGQLVEHVALGGAVGVVEDVRERLRAPPGGGGLRGPARPPLAPPAPRPPSPPPPPLPPWRGPPPPPPP